MRRRTAISRHNQVIGAALSPWLILYCEKAVACMVSLIVNAIILLAILLWADDAELHMFNKGSKDALEVIDREQALLNAW